MKKHFGLALALFTVLAFSAISVGTALASETEPVFLLNKEALKAEQATEASGELELADTKAVLGVEAATLCSGILDGKILFPETDHVIIEKVLNLKGEELGSLTSGLSAECSNVKNCAEPLVYPVHLPWLGLLVFMAGHEWKWLLELSAEGAGKPGWEVECMSLKLTDECVTETNAKGEEVPSGLLIENMPSGPLLGVFLRTELTEEKLLGSCSLGGKETGAVNSDEESGSITPVGGGELEVS